jgi:hypothetical protein
MKPFATILCLSIALFLSCTPRILVISNLQDIKDDVPFEVRCGQAGIVSEMPQDTEMLLVGKQGATPVQIGNKQLTIKVADTIVAQLGGCFGVEYSVVGKDTGQIVTITLGLEYPLPGLFYARTGERRFMKNTVAPIPVGASGVHVFCFDEPGEMVPGKWRFKISDVDRLFGVKEFEVVLPAGK